ncbi:hypothetical protein RKD40_006582 [Streptomyces ambofaciens]
MAEPSEKDRGSRTMSDGGFSEELTAHQMG